MHVRHEPNSTSAKQQMKGTPRGGEPQGTPRGAPRSSSQLDAVCGRSWDGSLRNAAGEGLPANRGLRNAALMPRGFNNLGRVQAGDVNAGCGLARNPKAQGRQSSSRIWERDLWETGASTADTQRLNNPCRG